MTRHHKLNVDDSDRVWTEEEAIEACEYTQFNRRNKPDIYISTVMMGATQFVEDTEVTCINQMPLPVYECRINRVRPAYKCYMRYCHVSHDKDHGHLVLRTLRCTDSLEEPIRWYKYEELIEIIE